MAEREDIVVTPIIQALLDKLASDVLQNFVSEWKVEKQVDELSETLANIEAMLGSLEILQTRDPLLKRHLKKLRDLAYHVDLVLDEFIYQVLHQLENENRGKRQVLTQHFSFSLKNDENQMLYQDEIAPLINELIEKLLQIDNNLKPHYYSLGSSLEMKEKLKTIQLQDDTRQKSVSLIADESHVVSREEDVNVIKNILLSLVQTNYQNEVPVISIVGMGGIGKTTLAQLVYNDPHVEAQFDLRAWVCVSDDFNPKRLSSAILESATGEPCNLKTLDPLQSNIQKEIRGKKFLLVLDDVWNENKTSWDALRVPFRFANQGSGIIITTRSTTVSSVMNAIYRYDLQGLSDEDCWSLIKARASLDENFISFPNLEGIGRKIAKKCRGLPLAATTLGGLLRSSLHENEWEDILQSNHWNNMLPALSVSYHYLPPHLKQCFAYCSLFPKGYEFSKEELVQLWMAEGFIVSKHVEIWEDIGSQYFDDLLARSFYQKIPKSYESRFVMHDLIHELAESVSGMLCVRVDQKFIKSRPKKNKSYDISKEAHRVSIFDVVLNSAYNKLFKCKSSYTFLLRNRFFSEHSLLDLFQESRWLRVLNLNSEGIKMLPDSIGELKHLRYLNLSGTSIEVLPESICKLYNLQTLNLSGCWKLKKLPINMRNLVKLRHLIIDKYFIDIPLEIGRLTCLTTLSFFNVGQTDGYRIDELKELRHLQGAFTISGLEKVGSSKDAKEANLKGKPKLRKLKLEWDLSYRNLDGDFDILGGLQPYKELEELIIDKYGGSRFPNWMMIDLLDYNKKLVSVTLDGCSRSERLPPLGQLPLLQSLRISGMLNVEQLGDEFYGGSKKRFPSLQILQLQGMDNLRKWFGADEGEFPCLKNLEISMCEKLRDLPPFLPAVKDLHISSCDELATLPTLPSISKLHLSRCDDRILSVVHHCTSLSSLCISGFPDLTTLPQNMLVNLAKTLESFDISDFSCLESLSEVVGLHQLTHLNHLAIRRCPSLTSLPNDLLNLTSLMDLTIGHRCDKLLSYVAKMHNLLPNLSRLCINRSDELKYWPSVSSNLSSLATTAHVKALEHPKLVGGEVSYHPPFFTFGRH